MVAIEQVHSWSAGRASCSASCSEALVATRVLPAREEAIADALELLRVTGVAAEWAARRAGTAGSAAEAASVVDEFGPLLLGWLGFLTDVVANEANDAAGTVLWDLDQRLHRVIARMMLLQELGLPIAGELGPLINRFGGLAGAPPAGLGAHLKALGEYLAHLRTTVETLAAAHPYR